MTEIKYSCEQYFNQSVDDSFRQFNDKTNRSMLSQDLNTIKESIKQQRQYFESEDVFNIQQMCNKHHSSINSEENEKNINVEELKKIFIKLDTKDNNNKQNNQNNVQLIKNEKVASQIYEKDIDQNLIQLDNFQNSNMKGVCESDNQIVVDQTQSQNLNQNASEKNKHQYLQKNNLSVSYLSEQQKQDKSTTYKKKLVGATQDIQNTKMIGSLLIMMNKKLKKFYYSRTYSGKGKLIPINARSQINDLSDISYIFKKPNIISTALKVILHYIISFLYFIKANKIPLFNPENPFKIFFNTVTASYNCFYLYITSMVIFFQADFGHNYHYYHQVAQVTWVLEMIIQMNTAMYHDNEFTTDRKKIIKCYFKEYLFFEMIPLIFENQTSTDLKMSILLKLPLILKLKGISIILEHLEFYILQILNNHAVLSLIKLILQTILLAHILSCFWSLITYYEIQINEAQTVWSVSRDILENNWQNRYLTGLYWSYTTMTNSQIYRPSTNLELLFTCCCILVSCISFGYILSSIGNILNEINKENKEYNKDLNILNKYMKRKHLQLSIVRRANISLKEYYLHQQKVNFQDERSAILKLNEYMREELHISAHNQFLSQFSFLSQVFTPASLKQIKIQMQEVLYAPNQVIFDNSLRTQDEQYLYFLMKGKVKLIDQIEQDNNVSGEDEDLLNYQDEMIFNSRNKSSLNPKSSEYSSSEEEDQKEDIGRIIQQGQCFGLHGFFTGHEIIKNAKSVGFTSVLKVSRQSVLHILKKCKRDVETFKQIADQLTFDKNLSCIDIKCEFCNQTEHESKSCIFIHFDKSNPYIIHRHNYSPQQERSKIIQRSQVDTKFNAIKCNEIIYDQIHSFREMNGYGQTMEQTKFSFTSMCEIQQTKRSQTLFTPHNQQDIKSLKFNEEKDQLENEDQTTSKEYIQQDKSAQYLTEEEVKEEIQKSKQSNLIVDFRNGKEDLVSPSSKGILNFQKSQQNENHFVYSNIDQKDISFDKESSEFNIVKKNSGINQMLHSKKTLKILDQQHQDKSSLLHLNIPTETQAHSKDISRLLLNSPNKSKNNENILNANSLFLILQNALKSLNGNQIDKGLTMNYHIDNQNANDLQNLQLDRIQNFDYYFRYYNHQNIMKKLKQIHQKFLSKNKQKITERVIKTNELFQSSKRNVNTMKN